MTSVKWDIMISEITSLKAFSAAKYLDSFSCES